MTESNTLAALRATLLPKLLSCELRLSAPMLRKTGMPATAQNLESRA